jgi:hypothetical protein
MGWDYYTFKNQPAFFIQEIAICIDAENKVKAINNSKINNVGKK